MPKARIFLFSLPLMTVAVVSFALFVVGAPRPYLGARVFGGATEDAPQIALRISVIESYAEHERADALGPLVVEAAFADGRHAAASATTDERGMAEVVLQAGTQPLHGPVDLRVSGRGRQGVLLARGKVALSIADWNARARVRGGWLHGAQSGPISVRVAPGRGAFAVPFADPLLIEVRNIEGPVARAKLEIEPDGLELDAKPPFETDAKGRAIVSIKPREHATSLKVVAVTENDQRGEWAGIVPVVPGALHAVKQGDQLVVESPIERDNAFFAIITEQARLAGGAVVFRPDGRGGALGTVGLPHLPSGPTWAVVSSDPELDSGASVGWPIGEMGPEPPLARAVPDRFLLDGLDLGRAVEAARRRSARAIALGFSALAALLAGILLSREVRRSSKKLDQHLADAGANRADAEAIAERPTRLVSITVALLCIGMGFLVVALVALYRIG